MSREIKVKCPKCQTLLASHKQIIKCPGCALEGCSETCGRVRGELCPACVRASKAPPDTQRLSSETPKQAWDRLMKIPWLRRRVEAMGRELAARRQAEKYVIPKSRKKPK